MKLILGNCLDKLKELDDNSVDSIVTDPPYGLSFMGKKWDYDVPSQEIWEECLRVLKPGGHLLAFAGSRTYHRMAVRIEDAGFEIRDQIMWIYGSGFPKSHNIGKAVDKKLNNSEWEGWGTALKPAHEPIVMARKPFNGTVVDNVLEWGTGGINIDGSRIGINGGSKKSNTDKCSDSKGIYGDGLNGGGTEYIDGLGRFPANIIFDEEAGKILDEQSENASRFFYCPKASKKDRNEGLDGFEDKEGLRTTGKGLSNVIRKCPTHGKFIPSGYSTYECGCKFEFSDDQTVKSTKNHHPTVKPTDLMLYLIRLVTPKNGTTLDPFMGSGSTGKAAIRGRFDFIGIEREKEYFDIAEARIQHEQNKINYTLL